MKKKVNKCRFFSICSKIKKDDLHLYCPLFNKVDKCGIMSDVKYNKVNEFILEILDNKKLKKENKKYNNPIICPRSDNSFILDNCHINTCMFYSEKLFKNCCLIHTRKFFPEYNEINPSLICLTLNIDNFELKKMYNISIFYYRYIVIIKEYLKIKNLNLICTKCGTVYYNSICDCLKNDNISLGRREVSSTWFDIINKSNNIEVTIESLKNKTPLTLSKSMIKKCVYKNNLLLDIPFSTILSIYTNIFGNSNEKERNQCLGINSKIYKKVKRLWKFKEEQ